jgi:phosphate acetyltransferase
VSFFRPIITGDPGQAHPDQDIDLMASHFQLAIPYEHMYGSTATEASTLLSLGKDAELLEGIIQKYRWLEAHSEFILNTVAITAIQAQVEKGVV